MMKNSPSFSFHLLPPVLSCRDCCLPLPPNTLNIYQTFSIILKQRQQPSIRRWTSNKSTTTLKNKAAWKAQACCTIHCNFIPRFVRWWALDCDVLHNSLLMTVKAIFKGKNKWHMALRKRGSGIAGRKLFVCLF